MTVAYGRRHVSLSFISQSQKDNTLHVGNVHYQFGGYQVTYTAVGYIPISPSSLLVVISLPLTTGCLPIIVLSCISYVYPKYFHCWTAMSLLLVIHPCQL